MDDKTFRILSQLEPLGIGDYKDISPILLSFSLPVNLYEQHSVAVEWGKIYRLLEDMKKNDFISIHPYPGISSGNNTNGYLWIDTIPIMACLNQKGHEALEKERNKGSDEKLRDSMFEVNQSIQQTNQSTLQTNISIRTLYDNTEKYYKAQRAATWVIAGATIINIFVSALPYITSKGEAKEQLQQLQTQNQQLKEQLEKLQKKGIPLTPLRNDTTHRH